MRKLCSLVLCFMMVFMCVPVAPAEDVPGEPASSSNAALSNLLVSGYDLDPVFDAATTGYGISIPNDVESAEITATIADANATLTIGGSPATSGAAQTVSGLIEGTNDIAVAVTAQDGTTVYIYTITITRAEAEPEPEPEPEPEEVSSIADLSGLSVPGYDLDPAFDAAITGYGISISNEVESVDITAITADSKANLTIAGSAVVNGAAQTVGGLAVGANEIVVAVSAQDTSVKTYTLTINRAEAEIHLPVSLTSEALGNADLSGLVVAGYNLTPAFDAATKAYTVSIPNSIDSVEVTATAADVNAAMTIGGTAASSGTAQTVNGLLEGINTVSVQITAADGNTSNTYAITIIRTGAGDLPQTPEAYAASDYAKYMNRMAAGSQHMAVVLQEGTVEVWGDNSYQQLEVTAEIAGIKAIAAGQHHTLALKEDGTVAAWGWNLKGQCNVPAELAGKTVKAVAARSQTSAALTGDNRIHIWGQYSGVLESTNNLVDIEMNNTYLLALAADGTVEAWKYSTLAPFTVPEGFSGNVVAISSQNQASLALKKDGSVVGWDDSYLPVGLTGVRAITAGRNFSAAIYQDGTMTVWGVDNSEFGFLNVPSDMQVPTALAAGFYDMYALQADGTIVSWGRNHYGQGDVPEEINLFSEVSTNDRLVVLSVESGDGTDLTIFPKFSCEQTSGMVEVASDIAQVCITAQAYSSTAVITANGNVINSGESTEINNLSVGNNPIELIVTAASGSQRSYTLHVKRPAAGDILPPLPQTPQAYQESDYAANKRRLATNSESVLVVKNDGTVAAWGQGQNVHIPSDAVDVVAVAVGSRHSLALKEDGTVVAWGYNDYGQCNVPADLTSVVDICVLGSSSIVLQANGSIRAWGQNQYGECNIPGSLNGVVDIQGGTRNVLALQADGTVAAWGDNTFLQSNVPADLDHVVAIAVGFRQNVALKDNGTIVIWGAEDPSWSKYAIGNLNQQYIKGIGMGTNFIAILKMDGSVIAWDVNMQPVLGIPVEQDKKTLAISAQGGIDHLLCLNEDGTVNVWTDEYRMGVADIPSGLNLFADDVSYNGPSPDIPQTPSEYAASDYVKARDKIQSTERGLAVLNMDGTVKDILTSSSDPFALGQVPEGLGNVAAIATSFRNIMALKEDGSVVVWGLNDDGQCTNAETLQDITAICATRDINSCCLALKNDGTVTAWGINSFGQRQVPDGLNEVTAIAAGRNHFVALKVDGTVTAWGDNGCGQCDVPAGLNNVARVFAQSDYSMALKNDGTVVAWGSNSAVDSPTVLNGQCDVPEGLNGVVDIYLSGNTCIALKNNGTVVVWGENNYGKRHVPPGLHDVAAVSCYNAAIAVKIDGSVECWGSNNAFDKQILTSLSNVLTTTHSIVILRDGSLQYYDDSPEDNETYNSMLEGLNVLSGHYFAIDGVDLLNSAGKAISTVASQGGYRIQAGIDNNYASPTKGLAIIQVRGGSNAKSESGGQVLGCAGISSIIPVSGATVSGDFTLPAGVSDKAYVDIFVWEDWETMVPRAEANQDLSFTISE